MWLTSNQLCNDDVFRGKEGLVFRSGCAELKVISIVELLYLSIFHINFEGFIYSTAMSNQNQIENSCEIGGVIITITIIALGIGIIGFLVWFLVFGLDL